MSDYPRYGAATGERYRINPDDSRDFEDGTHYTPEETGILRDEEPGPTVIRNLHILKKIFDGTIGSTTHANTSD